MKSAMTLRTLLLAAALAALGGCGEGSTDPEPPPPPPPPVTVKIGGTVSGLTGTIIMRDNGADDLSIANNGAFTFASSLNTGVAYVVSVATQPASQACAITNGAGTTGSADVTNVTVTCSVVVTAPSALSYPSPQTYFTGTAITPINPAVTGTVTSFSVSPALPAGLSLNTSTGQISGTPSAEAAAANYVITAANTAGSTTFSLTITVSPLPTDFTVSGTVTGLRGTGLVLRINGGSDLAVSASGPITFSPHLADQETYAVVVKVYPNWPPQVCTVTNGEGTVDKANVTNVAIDCVLSTLTDTDRDGLMDEVETALGTDPAKVDTDGDTLGDGEENLLWGSDPLSVETDGDGVFDGSEVANGTAPDKYDTDGDGLDDGVDPYPWRSDGDGDGLVDSIDPFPLVHDGDGGGASDGAELLLVPADTTDPTDPSDDRASTDSDSDFLSDQDEFALGTDPFNPDTDGDRVLDGLEVGTCDPLLADTDGDTVKDGTERAAGFKCELPDSDHDGLADNEEVGPTVADQDGDGLIDGVEERVYHSFSGVQDTDNDGLNDGDEVRLHRTDPIRADTDCDGVSDGQEVHNGTDPLQGAGGGTCSL